ncbi:DUF1295-domain-containing protein [Cylindrobasidium torrendii FP15055 ss-10]|uniref:DUF1295-domain-containing protein n=1 Tax=Cylindrobasidium torrendii FP15055 ss-10 TaxID=1314674 RepID=A0A0D7B092_9AGAR|nr:DUF1295-domain-containing protein [Cylindrobasidium torrendii FP15055 ss-10]
MTVFSRLLPTVVSAYGLQALCAAIFVPKQDERFYDISGSLGFATTAFLSLYYPSLKAKFYDGLAVTLPSLRSFAPRQLILTACLGIWTARLGSFLFMRVMKAGKDSRFDEVKTQPAKFSFFWFAQATWVLVVGLPVYLVNTLPRALHPALGIRDYAALGLIAASFAFEVTADRQKQAWRQAKEDKQHDEKFISSGLWSLSRHPNYVGEVGIWTGIWALSTATLQTPFFPRGTIGLALLSPALTYYLVRNLSGVPPLEAQAEKRWGTDPAWKAYKDKTPIFFPWINTTA